MKKILTIIIPLIVATSFGQTRIKKDNISSSGKTIQNNNKSLVYTVGEVAVKENTVNRKNLSEGFISPDIFSNADYETFGILQSVQIYPNPVKNILHLEFHYISDFNINFYDLNGKLLWQKNLKDDNHIAINLKNYNPGIYILVITDNIQKKLLMTKIEKT